MTIEAAGTGVYHRLNDREDRRIAAPDGSPRGREEIPGVREQNSMGEPNLPESTDHSPERPD